MGFEPTIAAGEQLKTYALDGATTGTGVVQPLEKLNSTHLVRIFSPFMKTEDISMFVTAG